MRRREFLGAFGSTVVWPLAARAQQPDEKRRIGVLVLGNPNPELFLNELRDGLQKLGYVDGRNIQLEIRSAGGRTSALPGAAADLIRLTVEIIVAWQTPAATAAKQATAEIPIVMNAGNPVETGLVTSLSRPVGNVTGMDSFGAQLGGKCIELIRDTIPSARRVAVLANAVDPFTKSSSWKLTELRTALGLRRSVHAPSRRQTRRNFFEDAKKWG